MARWEESGPQRSAGLDGRDDRPPEDLIPGGQKHYLLADGSILAQGYAPTKDITRNPCQNEVADTSPAFRLELLNDPNLPLDGPGRSINGTCALTEFEVTAGSA